jgi:hypothetical protein
MRPVGEAGRPELPLCEVQEGTGISAAALGREFKHASPGRAMRAALQSCQLINRFRSIQRGARSSVRIAKSSRTLCQIAQSTALPSSVILSDALGEALIPRPDEGPECGPADAPQQSCNESSPPSTLALNLQRNPGHRAGLFHFSQPRLPASPRGSKSVRTASRRPRAAHAIA